MLMAMLKMDRTQCLLCVAAKLVLACCSAASVVYLTWKQQQDVSIRIKAGCVLSPPTAVAASRGFRAGREA